MQNTNSVDQLLGIVKMFNENRELKAQKNGEGFNMFKICGVDHYEQTHSAILAEILDPHGSHGFGDRFLDAFIEFLKKSDLLDLDFQFDFNTISVHREDSSVFGRLDILIQNSQRQALLLENKIYAKDQFQQLKRYFDFGKREFGDNFKLIYLTLFGEESNDTEKEFVNYIQVSYSEQILVWLDRCIEIAARSTIVRETLIQYLNHIKVLTSNTITHNMNQDLIKKLATKENLVASYSIANNLGNVRNHIISTILLPQMREIGKEVGIIFNEREQDYVRTSWAAFGYIFLKHRKISNW